MTAKDRLRSVKGKKSDVESTIADLRQELTAHDRAWQERYKASVAGDTQYTPEQAQEDKDVRAGIMDRIQHAERELAAITELIPELEARVYLDLAQENREKADSLACQANEKAREFEATFNKAYGLLIDLNMLCQEVNGAEGRCDRLARLGGKRNVDFPARVGFAFDIRKANREAGEYMDFVSRPWSHKPKGRLSIMKAREVDHQ